MTSSFSSFPSSFSTFPDLNPPSTSNKDSNDDHSSRKKKRDRDGDKSKSKDKSRHKSRKEDSRERKESRRTQSRNTDEEHASNLYFRDVKGDKYNLQYGTLHEGDVPKYKLFNGGRYVLGLPLGLVAFRSGKGVEICEKSVTKRGSDLSSSSAKKLLALPGRRLALSSSTKYQEVDGVILFPSRKGAHSEELPRSVLVNKDHVSSDSEPPSEDEQSSSDEGERVLSSYELSIKELEDELAANPAASDKWLALLDVSLSTIPLTSKNATKARCEITLSILGRALEADPANGSNMLLRLTYINAGERIWDSGKLNAIWEEALRGGGIEIQMEWLEWRIREGKDGLDGIIESAKRISDNLPNTTTGEISRIRIFSRVAIVLRDAGFSERAMAMFQAEAELCPTSLQSQPLESILQELELFWDSEHERLGEPDAKGWDQWSSLSATTRDQPTLPSRPFPKVNIVDLDPYRQWAKEEAEYQKQSIFPTRSDCENADPYSTILFADIRNMLAPVRSKEAKHAFRLAWLSFLGLHLPGFAFSATSQVNWDDRWNLGYLTRTSYLRAIFPSDSNRKRHLPDSIAGALIGKEPEYTSPFCPVKFWSVGVQDPLDIISGQMPPYRSIWASEDIGAVDETVVRSVFAQLRLGKGDHEWDALALAFEAAISVKDAVKLSKSILSQSHGSLLHWDSHAKLQRMRGKLDDARKIYQTVLIASKPQPGQHEAVLLWWSWAEMEWLAGGEQASLTVIVKSVDLEKPDSGVTLLRCKRLLNEAIEKARNTPRWKEHEAWIKLRVLFELLTSGQLQNAISVAEQEMVFVVDEPARESLVTAILRLAYLNGRVLKRPCPPSLLRDRAEKALDDYSSNSFVLGMFLEGEKGQGVWGKVRSALGGNKAKQVARRIQEVWIVGWQSGQWANELERTRSGLTAAVEHERTRGSAVLWRIFVEFEIRANELGRARNLLFRAISECPLSKDLYLLAFGPLRGVFQRHELNTLADSMVERGLRLFQDIEDVVRERFGSPEAEKGVSGDEGEMDEIEERAAELRRLRPY